MSVEFIGPPPAGKNTKHHRAATALRGRPEEWGVVLRSASPAAAASAAQSIRTARLAAYAPAGSFQAIARTIDEGKTEHRVYARYVGGSQ
ncbi:hypothetical protein ACFYVL_27710 [Streptomyces sp. NPDC004111]|uniref:hypothetical protein n=1 Tax=Streptomyces sp. NPDC004111 TaxID=3364690 RepID=UPI00369218E4